MHMVAYISDCALEESKIDEAINSIVRTAKSKNPKLDITGVLLYLNGKFVQIIEGDERALRFLLKNIEADTRHKNITYLIDTKTPVRGFQDWNMDVFMLNKDVPFDALSMKKLTDSFQKNLLPRSDSLLFYYKALLAQKTTKPRKKRK